MAQQKLFFVLSPSGFSRNSAQLYLFFMLCTVNYLKLSWVGLQHYVGLELIICKKLKFKLQRMALKKKKK